MGSSRSMRDAIWSRLRARHPEGEMLPTWLLVARALLYPVDFFYWRVSRRTGYQALTDTWLIDGVRISGPALTLLFSSPGKVFRVVGVGDTLTIEEIQWAWTRKKLIELRIDGRPPRLVLVSDRVSSFVVPVLSQGAEFGERVYMDSGSRTDDGVPIWTERQQANA